MKKSIKPQPVIPVMPVVIVASRDEETINFATHGMYGQLSYEPPLIYISVIKEHLTAKIINKTKKFSVNIPDEKLLKEIKVCGNVSGADMDKSREFDVFYGRNDVPMVSKCPVNLNCNVYKTIETKDMYIFIGQITELFSDEDCLSDNVPDALKINPVLCTMQGFYRIGRQIEKL